jgi:glycosyltransferase involved in cell wall biosynthesis
LADVTVIIPVHNRADTIEATLASVAAQTSQPARVIVVDDASTDDSVEVVKRYPLANLEVLELKPNRGVGGARNAAAAEAQTTWLAFLDGDDTWEPEFIEQTMAAAASLNADFASTGGFREMVNKPTIVRLLDGRPEGAIDLSRDFWVIGKRWMPIVPSSTLVRKTLYFEAGGFEDDVKWGEEVPLFARLWLLGRFAFVNRPLYRSGQRPDGMSAVQRSYRDTALFLARLANTLFRAAARRKPGTSAFLIAYLHHFYRKHRNWIGGKLRGRKLKSASAS